VIFHTQSGPQKRKPSRWEGIFFAEKKRIAKNIPNGGNVIKGTFERKEPSAAQRQRDQVSYSISREEKGRGATWREGDGGRKERSALFQ